MALALAPAPGHACECISRVGDAVEALFAADYVFVGDVAGLKDGVATLHVREVFKGELRGTVRVRDGVSGMCEWPVFAGQPSGRYLVFADERDDELVTPWCPGTGPITRLSGLVFDLQRHTAAVRRGVADRSCLSPAMVAAALAYEHLPGALFRDDTPPRELPVAAPGLSAGVVLPSVKGVPVVAVAGRRARRPDVARFTRPVCGERSATVDLEYPAGRRTVTVLLRRQDQRWEGESVSSVAR